MFSISTMASSTRMPVTSVMASRLTALSEKPIAPIAQKVGMTERGKGQCGDHRRPPVAQEQQHHDDRERRPSMRPSIAEW